jgi:hypothetical protein
MIECNLCGMQFNNEYQDLLDVRKKKHERYHIRCKFQSRNMIEGTVKWISL